MDNLYLAFSVVFPLFAMMATGYLLRIVKLFDEEFLRKLNNLCFKVFLPLSLFINIYQSDFRQSFSPKLTLFAISCMAVLFTALMLIIPRLENDDKKKGVIVQGIFRGNVILFGIPVTISLFGEGSVGTVSILVATMVPMMNILAVVALESFGKIHYKTMLKNVATNPLIISSLIACLMALFNLRFPVLVEKTVVDMSRVATPLALAVLGGSFTFTSLKGYIRPMLIGVIGKLVVSPAIFLPISITMGFRGAELAALFTLFASPTAVSSYTMAQSMGQDGKLAAQIVVMDSMLSVVTMFIWILILKQVGVI